MRNILAIGAHPDDIELGCAGTLLKFAKAGHNVYMCVMSMGEQGGEADDRMQEQEESVKRLKAKELIWGNCLDTRFSVNRETIEFIDNLVDRVNPDEVYVNYYGDSHQDHRVLAQCVMAASRYVKRVLFYEDYTSTNFVPDIFVDIGPVLEDKIHVMDAFQSQVSKSSPSGLNMIDSIKAVANFRGFQAKVKHAEGFKALRYLKFDMH